MLNWLMILPTRLWQWFQPSSHQALLQIKRGTSWGDEALRFAKGTVGMGEEGANNQGPHIVLFRRGQGGRGAWCAAAASYWIEEAWLSLERRGKQDLEKCPVRRSHGARKLWKNVARAGAIVKTPMPGDLVLWSRGKSTWQGHIGIVARCNGNWFTCIEGNRGQFPSKVREYSHELGEPRLLGFARLPEAGA